LADTEARLSAQVDRACEAACWAGAPGEAVS